MVVLVVTVDVVVSINFTMGPRVTDVGRERDEVPAHRPGDGGL